jgi:hypothetical protein
MRLCRYAMMSFPQPRTSSGGPPLYVFLGQATAARALFYLSVLKAETTSVLEKSSDLGRHVDFQPATVHATLIMSTDISARICPRIPPALYFGSVRHDVEDIAS